MTNFKKKSILLPNTSFYCQNTSNAKIFSTCEMRQYLAPCSVSKWNMNHNILSI